MRTSAPMSAAQNPISTTVQMAKQMDSHRTCSPCAHGFDIRSLSTTWPPRRWQTGLYSHGTDWEGIASYHSYVKGLEREAYPGEINPGGMVEGGMTTGLGRKYSLFAPSWFFQSASLLMTEVIVTDLLDNAKSLLSVGCGPAHLERFMVSQLGIDRQQITLADIDGLHVPGDFKHHQFDMLVEWPRLDQRFDYIIFPESFFPRRHEMKPWLDLYHIFKSGLAVLNPGGQIRATYVGNNIYEPFERMIKSTFPRTTTGRLNAMVYLLNDA